MLTELLLAASCNPEDGFYSAGVFAFDFSVDYGISWMGMLTIVNHLSCWCLGWWCWERFSK